VTDAPADLAGRVVIVTAGTRGIGLGIAATLSRAGASVLITGRKQHRLDHAVQSLAAIGAPPLALRCDVADREQTCELVKRTVARSGRLDGLVSNARSFRPTLMVDGGGYTRA